MQIVRGQQAFQAAGRGSSSRWVERACKCVAESAIATGSSASP